MISCCTILLLCGLCVSGTKSLRVFNKVLGSSQLVELDSGLSTLGSNHYLYDRAESPRSAVEMAVNTLCEGLEDESRYVELWHRSNWISLDAHQDIDEKLACEQGSYCKDGFHYPEFGHVLYLDVGSKVQGSTIVFDDKEGKEWACGDCERFDQAVAVPPVAGRLLRFEGQRYHAVVRPALSFFEPHCYELHSNSRKEEPAEFRRSVLLFNTWEKRPLVEHRVPTDEGGSAGSFEVSFDEEACVARLGSRETQEGRRMKVGLLGDSRRRGINRSLFLELKAYVSDDDLDRIQSARDPVSWPISAK